MATGQGPILLQNSNGNYTGTIQLAESVQIINPATKLPRAESISTFISLLSAQIASGSQVQNKTDISDMLSGSYTANDLIYVADASAWSTLTNATFGFFQYLGGGESSASNYRLLFAREWFTGSFIDHDNSSSGLTAVKVDPAIAELKQLIDNTAAGLKWKEPVELATTINITLSGEQTIDGTLTSTSRILVKGQTDKSENGIYTTDAGSWARAADMDADNEVLGFVVNVLGGTENTDTNWQQSGAFTTLDTDDINIIPFSSNVQDWSETVAGKVEKANQTESETGADATEGNRDHTKGLTARGTRWLIDALDILTDIAQNASNIGDKQSKDIGATDGNIGEFLSEETVDSGNSFGVQADAENAMANKIVDAANIRLGLIYYLENIVNSNLNTVDKRVIPAINELEDRNTNIWHEYSWIATAGQTDFVIAGANAGEINKVDLCYIKKVGGPAIAQFVNDGNISVETTTVTNDTIRTSEALGVGDIVYLRYWRGANIIAIPQVVGLTTLNKGMSVASQISGDNAQTGLFVDGIVNGDFMVFIEGIKVGVGDGVKTDDSYLSLNGGSTALTKSNIIVGAQWIWNANINSGRFLNPIGPLLTDYRIDFVY